jgi:4-amino-4-deoxy-L-arabinose transferase-like glycosyltransferase
MERKTRILLIAIFLFVVALRLYFAFQIKGLDYDAYAVVRQVEHIKETGTPMFNDPLSYSGRTHIFSPVYHYFLASFTFLLPLDIVAKIIPNILASLTLVVVFFFALYFIKDEKLALLMAALSGIIPVFFDNTLNNASIYTAVIPLFLLTAYFFVLTHKDDKHVWKLLFTMVLLTFLHPTSLILMFCFLIYILLINLENFRKNYRETELVLFFLFFVFWANITIYKRALLAHGDLILFQNIPVEIISHSFKNITFLEAIYSVGVIPIIFGLIAVYIALFVSNSKSLMLVTSISLGMFVLLWFKLIGLNEGLMFLSMALIVLAAYSIGRVYERTKMVKLKHGHIYFISTLLIISLAMFIPGVLSSEHNSPSNADVQAFIWLKNNTPAESVVMVLPEEGSALSYFSERKNVMDDDYLLIKNINTRYDDVTLLYKDLLLTNALERLNYYSVNYVILSEYNQKNNNITNLAFADDSCVVQVYPSVQNDSSQLHTSSYLNVKNNQPIKSNPQKIRAKEDNISGNVTANINESNLQNISENQTMDAAHNITGDVAGNIAANVSAIQENMKYAGPKIYKVNCRLLSNPIRAPPLMP